MARHGGRVHLEQSDVHLSLNLANMTKEWFSRAAIDETQQAIKKQLTEVWGEMKSGVVVPGDIMMKDTMDRQQAMVRWNRTDGGLSRHNGTAKDQQTHFRRKGTGAAPARAAPPRPGTRPAPPDDGERTQISETEIFPRGYLYIHSLLPNAPFFNLDPYAKARMRDKDFIPDLLTDESLSTGWYSISYVVMQLTAML